MNNQYPWNILHNLQRVPLLYKILIANSLIVAIGAMGGTIITAWFVERNPQQVWQPLIAFFAIVGIAISFVINSWVLKRALDPLDRLQQAVDAVRCGQLDLQATPGPYSDERFDRLVDTFNRMVNRLEENVSQMHHLSRSLMQAQEAERQRLALELHDEAAQALTSLLVHLRLLERAQEPAQAQQQVEALRELTALALEEVRRVAVDLRPKILDDLGLAPALEWRIDEFNLADGVEATIAISGLTQRLPRDVELVFYRVGQEALSNVARHAQATHVELSLTREDELLTLEVSDDGVGFDANANRVSTNHGFGLLGMRERLSIIGGTLQIDSRLGGGTRLIASAPVAKEISEQPVDDLSELSGNGHEGLIKEKAEIIT